MKAGYRQLDHTGDIGIEAEAPDEASLYACCAAALFGILAGDSKVEPRESITVEASGEDRAHLLVRWLGELLYLHETARWIFGEFDVVPGEAPGGGFRISARLRGERFDPSRHRLRTGIKAVTHHQAAVTRLQDGTWRARVIFDI
jgi:SHS2 domain-containing protein